MHRLPSSNRRRQIEHYLMKRVKGVIPILPFDTKAAEWQARDRARLEGVGRTPQYEDSQIAAIAVVNGLTLVTRNTGDFAGFAELNVENWFE